MSIAASSGSHAKRLIISVHRHHILVKLFFPSLIGTANPWESDFQVYFSDLFDLCLKCMVTSEIGTSTYGLPPRVIAITYVLSIIFWKCL